MEAQAGVAALSEAAWPARRQGPVTLSTSAGGIRMTRSRRAAGGATSSDARSQAS